MRIRDYYWFVEDRGGALFEQIVDGDHPLFGRHTDGRFSVGDRIVVEAESGLYRCWKVTEVRAVLHKKLTGWAYVVEEECELESWLERGGE